MDVTVPRSKVRTVVPVRALMTLAEMAMLLTGLSAMPNKPLRPVQSSILDSEKGRLVSVMAES